MAIFKVEVKGYDIVTCIQVQTIMYYNPLTVNIDNAGNGSVKLTATSPDEAIDLAKKQIEIYKKQ
jgi:hypothetical protein